MALPWPSADETLPFVVLANNAISAFVVAAFQEVGREMSDTNIWSEEWDSGEDWSGGGARSKRLPLGSNLGATVYELKPGAWVPFHFHHGSEELMVVLRGQPTLRTGKGERRLHEGEVVHFPTGPDGAHALSNGTNEPVRYLMASTLASPEVVEYPDLRQITAQAQTGSQTGERLWLIHDLSPEADNPSE